MFVPVLVQEIIFISDKNNNLFYIKPEIIFSCSSLFFFLIISAIIRWSTQ